MDLRPAIFILAGMKKPLRLPSHEPPSVLDQLQVRLLEPSERPRFDQLPDQHHELGSLPPFGERLYYVATDAR